jgi:hypothetical protein
MKPENAVHCFDLDRFDKEGMRNRDRMQNTFERFLPKLQKTLQFREIWVEVVVLPDVALQQPGMVWAPYRMFAVVRPYPSTCFRKSCEVTRISGS